MKLTWLAALVLAACHPGGGDDYPIQPGGGDDTSTEGRFDAAVPDGGDAGGSLLGQVCLVVDLRDPVSCAMTGAGGLQVTLGGEVATTLDDGRFTITNPPGSNLVWHVMATGAASTDFIPSVMPLGTRALIPVVTTQTYADALDGTGILLAPGDASVFLHLVRGNANVTGATANANPAPTDIPRYDGATPTTWNANTTGPKGMVWIAGADPVAGPVTITVAPPLAATQMVTLPVEPDSITFATVSVP